MQYLCRLEVTRLRTSVLARVRLAVEVVHVVGRELTCGRGALGGDSEPDNALVLVLAEDSKSEEYYGLNHLVSYRSIRKNLPS